jgi:hypothetical protein
MPRCNLCNSLCECWSSRIVMFLRLIFTDRFHNTIGRNFFVISCSFSCSHLFFSLFTIPV